MVWGRIQSREYMKKISEEEVVRRVAYEVSVSKLEVMDGIHYREDGLGIYQVQPI